MATNVGEIYYDLGLQTSAFDRSMAAVSGKLKAIGQSMSNVGRSMTTGVTLPIMLGAGFAVKAASDLVETINKVKVAFKANSKEVLNWSKNSITSMGLARESALDAAALFGDMGTSMGLSTKAAAKMSMNLTQLGADLASFKNIKFSEAQTALAGIFTGETESLKKLGIVMTETNLLEYARSKGITKTVQEMTQAEKVQLRYNYILDKTKNAQGDFIRTQSGTANQLRMTQERFKELAATVGAVLLPTVNQLLGFLNDLMKKFQELTPGQQKMILIFIGIAAAIGPVLWVGGQLLTLFGLIVAHPIIAAIAVLIAALMYLQIKFQALNPAIAVITQVLNATLIPMFKYLWTIIKTQLLPVLQELWQKHGKEIMMIFKLIGTSVGLVLLAFLMQLTAAIIIVTKVITFIITVITKVVSWLNSFGNAANSAGSTFGSAARSMGASLVNFYNGLVSRFNSAVNFVRGLSGRIRSAFGNAGSMLYGIGRDIINGLRNGISNAAGGVYAKVQGMVNNIKAKFREAMKIGSPSKVFAEYGKNITDGLVLGMQKGTRSINAQVDRLMPKNVNTRNLGNINNNSNQTINIGTIQDRSDADYLMSMLDRNQRLSGRGGSPQYVVPS